MIQWTNSVQFSSLQSLSHVRLFAIPWTAARQASLCITNSQSSLKLMSIESVMPSSHLILCRPLLLLPPIPPNIRVFTNESTLRMMWPKYWSFSFSINHFKEYPGLISFRTDWLDLLEVQGTLKSLLQHNSSKASILWLWAFFTVQLSHPYMTTGKTIALTRRTFVVKVVSLLLNMLSRLVITFLQKLWDSVKAVLRGRFIAIQAYLKKQEKSQINNLTLHLKQLEKEEMENPRISRRKEIIKIRAEINTKETIAKINKAKCWFFER